MTMDRETTETLRDEPELLAIADALQSAGEQLDVPVPVRGRARPRRVRLVAVALAVAAVIAVVLASPWSGSSGPSLVDKALAAVGDKPVLHDVLRYQFGERVNLRTGRSSPSHRDVELWYDSSRHIFRTVTRLDGRVIMRTSGRGDLRYYEPFLVAALYRKALEQGKLRKTGETIIRGHRAIVLRSKLSHSGEMQSALDADTYRLLRLQYFLNGRLGYQLDVLRYETVSREQAHLPKHPSTTNSSTHGTATVSGTERGSGVVGEEALAKARTAFGHPAVWPGRSVDGHRLVSSQLEKQSVSEKGRRTVHGQMLTLDYGPRGRGYEPYLEIQEAPVQSSLWDVQHAQAPPAGSLDLTSGQTSTGSGPERTRWTGVMQKDGLTIQLTSWSRAALLAAARALRPVP